MSDVTGTRHEWRRGESLQWSRLGEHAYGLAQTPFKCERCGKSFIHFYHQNPNIYAAMEEAGINPDECKP